MRKIFTWCYIHRIFCVFIITGFIAVKTEASTRNEKPIIFSNSKSISAPCKQGLARKMQPVNGFANKNDTSGRNWYCEPPSAVYPAIYINLLVPQNGISFLTDGVAGVFDNSFSAIVNGDDAIKLWNFSENIALVRDHYTLAIEFRPVPKLMDTLFLRLYLKQQPYTLQVCPQNFAGLPAMKVWIEDTYLHTKAEINLQDTTLYNFTPNTDTLSYRNRFMVVFERQFTATPIAVTKIINQDNPNITGITNSIVSKTGSITVYPNPVAANNKTMLQFDNMDKGSYVITVYNSGGQRVAERTIQHNGGSAVYPLILNSSLAGVYSIRALNEDLKKIINFQLVINK
jgi:hypothetical protein